MYLSIHESLRDRSVFKTNVRKLKWKEIKSYQQYFFCYKIRVEEANIRQKVEFFWDTL